MTAIAKKMRQVRHAIDCVEPLARSRGGALTVDAFWSSDSQGPALAGATVDCGAMCMPGLAEKAGPADLEDEDNDVAVAAANTTDPAATDARWS